ncbi:UPF0280 family protein [Ottowia thiooxydans]|uniref:ApbE superfamily uncharacterized protein (UPF0280 family) n=1 Tax=Ottowia thiooxydans TaxID=219182 RepID=A0ABV2Q8D7_9BURK
MNAERQRLDAHRWHWQHGPIDIVAEAHGAADAVAAAHEAAWERFHGGELRHGVLTELVGELPLLRQPVTSATCPLHGPIAQRMWRACTLFLPEFITPMAAVAGSVAQELIACYQQPGIERAWLNNGGDIALHLAPGQSVRVGLFSDLARFDLADMGRLSTDGRFEIRHTDPVRGVATSGWRGRSFSMGIADSVTVLAATAAQADAAASIIANAVNVNDAAIQRQSANTLKDDTDLGERLVTTLVPPLHPNQVQRALDAGEARARALQQAGLVWAVLMVCQEQWRHVEPISLLPETQKVAGAVLA